MVLIPLCAPYDVGNMGKHIALTFRSMLETAFCVKQERSPVEIKQSDILPFVPQRQSPISIPHPARPCIFATIWMPSSFARHTALASECSVPWIWIRAGSESAIDFSQHVNCFLEVLSMLLVVTR